MVVQPGVEVKSVPDAAAPEANRRDAKPVEESDADAEIVSGFLFREAARRGARQCSFFHQYRVQQRHPSLHTTRRFRQRATAGYSGVERAKAGSRKKKWPRGANFGCDFCVRSRFKKVASSPL